MKYKVDEWVIYKPFANDDSPLLKEMQSCVLILDILDDDYFYDYKVYDKETQKIKKVREHQLFPMSPSTY